MKNTTYPWLDSFERKFVPSSLKAESWDDLEPYYERLVNQEIKSVDDLKQWLSHWTELESISQEVGTDREILMSCHTEDEKIKKAYLDFVKNFEPPLKTYNSKLKHKFLDSPYRQDLEVHYNELNRFFQTSIDLFKEENLSIETEIDELSQNYQEITGSWMVDFEGKERTMPEMSEFLESSDRDLREKAWKASIERRLRDADQLDSLFDKLLVRRQKIATQLGLKDYREYIFKRNLRDYSPEDCLNFHQATEEAVLPLIKKLREKRKSQMGLDQLRPWDTECDPEGRDALKPFETVTELQDGVEAIFSEIDSRFKDFFHSIRPYQDLDSRRGKAPGGYQATFEEKRIPFIFSNSSGSQRDVETLLHEAGHSFHSLQARNQDLIWYRSSAMEFCEVASMSQELLGGHHLHHFYKDPELAERARLRHLESVLFVFPWVMTVDAFQHWIYTHPNHSIEERDSAWREQFLRFSEGISWEGLDEKALNKLWHRQLHIFLVPFYYIEYAISQLGSIQIYRNYKKDSQKALSQFLEAMSYGGSLSCPKLYKKAGIEFRFDTDFVKELVDLIAAELNL